MWEPGKKPLLHWTELNGPRGTVPLNTTAITLVCRLSAIPDVTVIWNNEGRMTMINT